MVDASIEQPIFSCDYIFQGKKNKEKCSIFFILYNDMQQLSSCVIRLLVHKYVRSFHCVVSVFSLSKICTVLVMGQPSCRKIFRTKKLMLISSFI